MTKIAFLGLGAMGRRMAARLVAAGHEVTVWNRTPGTDLVAGARLADGPRAAVLGAEVVLSMVRDDAASAAVWLEDGSGALAGLAPGAVGIEVSTISPSQARGLHDEAGARGVAFMDAPVVGSRPQAEAGQLIFLAGGAAETVARVETLLLQMGGAVHHAGGPGDGAALKLVVNALFAAQLATIAELLGLAQATGLDPARAVGILTQTPVASPALAGAAQAMLAGRFAPAFPIDLVVKDLGLALGAGRDLPVTGAVAEVYREAAREGLGEENITAVVQRYLRG